MAGTVAVPVKVLQDLERELADLRQQLDDVGRLRIDCSRAHSRVRSILAGVDLSDEKTPLRPPSTDAMKAFQSSSEFLAVKLPKRER